MGQSRQMHRHDRDHLEPGNPSRDASSRSPRVSAARIALRRLMSLGQEPPAKASSRTSSSLDHPANGPTARTVGSRPRSRRCRGQVGARRRGTHHRTRRSTRLVHRPCRRRAQRPAATRDTSEWTLGVFDVTEGQQIDGHCRDLEPDAAAAGRFECLRHRVKGIPGVQGEREVQILRRSSGKLMPERVMVQITRRRTDDHDLAGSSLDRAASPPRPGRSPQAGRSAAHRSGHS